MEVSDLDQIEFGAEIRLFEDYLATMESFLTSEADKYNESLKNIRASRVSEDPAEGQIPDDELHEGQIPDDELYDQYQLEAIDQFTHILRISYFTTLYAFFENKLVTECRSRKNNDTPQSFSDIAGQNDLERAKTYFTKVLRTSFPSNMREWQEIQHYRRLRNCLVHNRGRLDDSRDYKSLREYVTRKTSLSAQYNEVSLKEGFCAEALETIKSLLLVVLFGKQA